MSDIILKILIGAAVFLILLLIIVIVIIVKLRKKIFLLNIEKLRLDEIHKEFRETERMKTEFMTTVAHQLRTPLTRIKWAFQSIISGDTGKITDKQKEVIEIGAEANDKMVDVVNTLLDAQKTEGSYFGYKFERVPIENIITRTINSFNFVAKQKKINLGFYAPEEKIPDVTADIDKISLVLGNLLDNAISYTPAGGEVKVILENFGNSARVSVKDSGIGIPKNDLYKLFTRFFRAKNAVSVRTEGSGLGLYVAKNIIDAHGGKIWVESQEGKGTTFYFTIQLAKEDNLEQQERIEEFVRVM